jgi:hypothetical protein
MVKKIIIVVLVLLVLIQFIRPVRNNGDAFTNQDIMHTVTVPDSVQRLLQASCYDCHSNHTTYPWYAQVNPVGNWLAHHVDEGKEELNFSEFKTYSKKKAAHKLDEVVAQLQRKEMPLSSYTLIHKEAKLTEAQCDMLINWAAEAKEELMNKGMETP